MIKRSTAARVFAETLGFCLAALFGFSMAIAIDMIFTRPLTGFNIALSRWPLMICYFAGRFCSKKRPGRKIICIAAVVVSMILTMLMAIPWSIRSCFGLLFCVVPAILLLRVGLICVPLFPQGYALGSVVVYLVNLVGLTGVLGYKDLGTVISVCAILDFLFTLISANRKSTLDGVHSPGTKTPAGISSKSFLLLMIFTAISFGIAFIIALRGWLADFFESIGYGIYRGIIAFAKFVSNLFPEPSGVPEEISSANTDSVFTDVEVGAWKYLVIAFCALFSLLIVVLMTRFIMKMFKNRTPRQRKKRKFKFFQTNVVEEQEGDEVENTIDLEGFFDKMKDDLAESLKKLKRKPTFSDMKTDAERVRFAFREFKRYRLLCEGEKGHIESRTPLDLAKKEDNDTLLTLVDYYNALKYGEIEPGAPGGKNAGESMQELKRRKKA